MCFPVLYTYNGAQCRDMQITTVVNACKPPENNHITDETEQCLKGLAD